MERRDGKRWNVIERAVNGYTAKDLLKLIQNDHFTDVSMACVMIGTNDAKEQTDPETFGQYIRRIDTALRVKHILPVWGQIPPIYLRGGDYPYTQQSIMRRNLLVKYIPASVPTDALGIECYEDAVHFNEQGNKEVAKLFAEAICK